MLDKIFGSANHKTRTGYVAEVALTFAAAWFWVLFLSLFLMLVLGSVPGMSSGNSLMLGVAPNFLLHDWHMSVKEAISSGLGWQLITACIAAPFLEEIIFRGLVCNLSADVFGKLRHWGPMLILTGAFILFGLAHRNGLYSVALQGVIGLFFARLWFRNGPNQKASYFSCVAAHALYNFSVVTVVYLS